MKIAPISTNIIKPIVFGNKINKKDNSSENLNKMLGLDKRIINEISYENLPSYGYKIPNKGYYSEYYFTGERYGIRGKLISCEIFRKKTEKGTALFILENGTKKPYCASERKFYNGQIVETISYSNGFPSLVTEYKDGKPFREIRYNPRTHRKNQVIFLDQSFELSKHGDKERTRLNLNEKKNNRNVFIIMHAPKENGRGYINCLIRQKDKDNKIKENSKEIHWTFPEMSVETSGDGDKEEIINALKHLQEVIYSPEYREDFGKTGYLNVQLRDVIRYLEKNNQ